MLVRFTSDALHSSSGWQAEFSAGNFRARSLSILWYWRNCHENPFLTNLCVIRLPAASIRRGSVGVEQRHGFRHNGDVLLPPGTGIRHRQGEDHHGVLTRRELVRHLHSQLSGSLLRTGTADWQWFLDRILERHLSRPGYLSVLRRFRLPVWQTHRENLVHGWREVGEEAVLFRWIRFSFGEAENEALSSILTFCHARREYFLSSQNMQCIFSVPSTFKYKPGKTSNKLIAS